MVRHLFHYTKRHRESITSSLMVGYFIRFIMPKPLRGQMCVRTLKIEVNACTF